MRERVREFIETMVEAELEEAVLSRPRYVRSGKPSSPEAGSSQDVTGHRHGHRSRSLLGTFGRVEIVMPRARLNTPEARRRNGRAAR
jgi:transposase-like protein